MQERTHAGKSLKKFHVPIAYVHVSDLNVMTMLGTFITKIRNRKKKRPKRNPTSFAVHSSSHLPLVAVLFSRRSGRVARLVFGGRNPTAMHVQSSRTTSYTILHKFFVKASINNVR